MRINANVLALKANNRLVYVQKKRANSLEKLASGCRINRAADDAAGLAISEKLLSQIRGSEQARRNVQDGISLVQTAEGGLKETTKILQRLRKIAVQAASDTNSVEDRQFMQNEVEQLVAKINNIARNTRFNTRKLLDGSFRGDIQVGPNREQSILIEIASMDSRALGMEGSGSNVGSIGGETGLVEGGVETALDISSYSGEAGTVSFELSGDFTTGYSEDTTNLSGIGSTTISSGSYSQEYTDGINITYNEDLNAFGASVSEVEVISGSGGSQTSWNVADPDSDGTFTAVNPDNGDSFDFTTDYLSDGETLSFTVNETGEYTGSIDYTATDGSVETIALTNFDPTSGQDLVTTSDGLTLDLADNLTAAAVGKTVTFTIGEGTEGINVETREKANAAIKTIDKSLGLVTGEQSKLGAYQNRMGHIMNNLKSSYLNLKAANSRIKDTDMARQMLKFTRNQILEQAGNAMLVQANQTPELTIQLFNSI